MKRKSITAFERDVQLARVTGLTDADANWRQHLSKADLVVEAVFEEIGVKHKARTRTRTRARADGREGWRAGWQAGFELAGWLRAGRHAEWKAGAA